MRRLSFTVIALLVVALPAAAQQTATASLEATVDSLVSATLRADRTPGMSVAVIRGADTLVMKGYGLADVEHDVPVTDRTVFRIGSLTKQFTSAAIMKLVDEGRIRLDATIADYLPDYAGPGRTVTIHQLLNHTSGIPSYTSMGPEFWDKSRLDLTHDQILEFFESDSLEFAAGTQWSYNNSGYYLLGMIIEEVTDETYAEHLERVLWQPLGLAQTSYCGQREIIPHRAQGYALDGPELINAPPLSMNPPFSAGALCSTARDLARWNAALVSGEVVSPASYTKMISPTTLADGTTQQYGYGLGPSNLDGREVVAHAGGINGFSAFMSYHPADSLTVVVLANGPTDGGQVAERIARHALGLPLPVEPVATEEPLPAGQEELYVGTYDLAPAVPLQVRVFQMDGRLMAQATGQVSFPLRYQGGHRFEGPPAAGVAFEFTVENGRATGFTLFQGGAELRATRIE